MKTILAPIDFSPVTTRVIDEAAALARAVGARVALVHVIRLPQAATEYAFELGSELITSIEQGARRRLEELVTALEKRGVAAESVAVTGAPAIDILAQAEKVEADYIVIGSHGHTALYDLVIGSTAAAMIKRAGCPVVVVPASKRARARQKPEASRAAVDKLAMSA